MIKMVELNKLQKKTSAASSYCNNNRLHIRTISINNS